MTKLNCWEFKRCGRQPEGMMSHELGVCPASTESMFDGLNGGVNSGRTCWVIAGTLCGGKVQGKYAAKIGNCMDCDFYKKVLAEEGRKMVSSKQLLEIQRTKLSPK